MSGDNRRRRGVLSHWVPLVLTVTVATVGLAAWVWSQRRDEDDERHDANVSANAAAYHDLDYNNADYGDNPPYGKNDDRPSHAPGPLTADSTGVYSTAPAPAPGVEPSVTGQSDASWGNRMSGALRRAPSPQQIISNTSKTVAAGVAAAGAAVGSALATIREDDKAATAAHEAWAQEADAKRNSPPLASGALGGTSTGGKKDGKKRKVVAVVVSADTHIEDADEDGFHEVAVSFPVPKCRAVAVADGHA
jgi:hypothetical protein